MESKNRKQVVEEEDDDDCPPPLEDMSDHLSALKSIKNNQSNQVSKQNDEEDVEEVRLAPKKPQQQQPLAAPTQVKESKAIPSRDFDEPKEGVKQQAIVSQPEKKKDTGFGGMKGGFLNGGGAKRSAQPKPAI